MPGKSIDKHRRRAAGVYVVTVLISMTVTGTAVTLLSMQMANRRLSRNISVARQAELTATAGLEWVLGKYGNASKWRTSWTSGQTMDRACGLGGVASVTLTEPDGIFTDDDTEPADMTVVSVVNGAKYALKAVVEPKPHETLARALFAFGTTTFTSAATITGPIHADFGYVGFAGITASDNGGCSTLDAGVVVGSVPNLTRVTSVEYFPNPYLTYYLPRATALADVGGGPLTFRVSTAVLSETRNTAGGGINTDGIYVINADGENVQIDNVCLKGTLIIQGTTVLNSITFGSGCRLEPGSKGYPTLLIPDPALSVTFAPTGPLDEGALNVDFNGDADRTDTIPSGLFGITRCEADTMTLGGAGVVYRGSIIAINVTISNSIVLDDDPTVAARLAAGFIDSKLHLRKGSVRETTP